MKPQRNNLEVQQFEAGRNLALAADPRARTSTRARARTSTRTRAANGITAFQAAFQAARRPNGTRGRSPGDPRRFGIGDGVIYVRTMYVQTRNSRPNGTRPTRVVLGTTIPAATAATARPCSGFAVRESRMLSGKVPTFHASPGAEIPLGLAGQRHPAYPKARCSGGLDPASVSANFRTSKSFGNRKGLNTCKHS